MQRAGPTALDGAGGLGARWDMVERRLKGIWGILP